MSEALITERRMSGKEGSVSIFSSSLCNLAAIFLLFYLVFTLMCTLQTLFIKEIKLKFFIYPHFPSETMLNHNHCIIFIRQKQHLLISNLKKKIIYEENL